MIAMGKVWDLRCHESNKINKDKKQQKMVDELKQEILMMRGLLENDGIQDSSLFSIENEHDEDGRESEGFSSEGNDFEPLSAASNGTMMYSVMIGVDCTQIFS